MTGPRVGSTLLRHTFILCASKSESRVLAVTYTHEEATTAGPTAILFVVVATSARALAHRIACRGRPQLVRPTHRSPSLAGSATTRCANASWRYENFPSTNRYQCETKSRWCMVGSESRMRCPRKPLGRWGEPPRPSACRHRHGGGLTQPQPPNLGGVGGWWVVGESGAPLRFYFFLPPSCERRR